jgi:hypothetical protein
VFLLDCFLFGPLSFILSSSTMASLVSLIILLEAVALVASNPVAQPTITAPARVRRDFTTEGVWTGWYQETDNNGDTTLTSYTVNSDYALVSTGTLVYLCATTSSDWESSCSGNFATACTGTTAYYLDGSFSECSVSCNADTVFTTNTLDTNGLHWFGCANRAARLYFEVEPTDTTSLTTTSTSTSTSTDGPTPGGSTPTGPSPTASRTPSPKTSPTSTAPPEPAPAKSQAWIAGPVIGGVAAVGIAGLIFWFLRRRKQKAVTPAYQPAPQMMQSPHPYQSPSLAHAASPNLATYGDHNGYYGQVENKPDTTVYAHNAPGYAPVQGTMQMPAGVSEYNGAPSQGYTAAPHMAGPVSELPSNPPAHTLPELGNGDNVQRGG